MNNKLKRNANKLLNNSFESYYWIGFLMADGYISVKNNIRFTLSIKDEQQLLNFRNFLNINNKLAYIKNDGIVKYVTFSINDIETCQQLRELYQLTNNKTINPPNIDNILSDPYKFLSFFVGLFDGDGAISYKTNIPNTFKIECHNNWFDILNSIKSNLKLYFDIDSTLKTTKRGYAKLSICKYKHFVKIKEFITNYNIPVMSRKWDNIDPTREYRGKTPPKVNNKSVSYFDKITYKGETKSLKEWSNFLNINIDKLRLRLARNWSIERAFIN